MVIDFAELVRSKSDEELQSMIAIGEREWAAAALAAARAELGERGVEVPEPDPERPVPERPAAVIRTSTAAIAGRILGGLCVLFGLVLAANGGISLPSLAVIVPGVALLALQQARVELTPAHRQKALVDDTRSTHSVKPHSAQS